MHDSTDFDDSVFDSEEQVQADEGEYGAEQPRPSHVAFAIICALILATFLLCYFLAPVWAIAPLIAIVFIEPIGYKVEKKVFLLIAILIIALFSFFFGFGGKNAAASPVYDMGGSVRVMPMG